MTLVTQFPQKGTPQHNQAEQRDHRPPPPRPHKPPATYKMDVRSSVVKDPMQAFRDSSNLTGTARQHQQPSTSRTPGAPSASGHVPPAGRHAPKPVSQLPTEDITPADGDAGQAADQQDTDTTQAGAFPQHSSGFMGMLGGVGAAAHQGSPAKAAEMLRTQQSPTAEKVGGLVL